MEMDNTQKGIRLEATFGQFLSAIILTLLLFALPIAGYEVAKGQLTDKQSEVYTASTLGQNDVATEGRVAGVSTTSTSNNESIMEQTDTLFESKYLLMGAGIVLILISTSLSAGLFYDFLKK